MRGLWLSCAAAVSCCVVVLGDPQLWHFRLTFTDCPWDAVLPAVAQFHFPTEWWGFSELLASPASELLPLLHLSQVNSVFLLAFGHVKILGHSLWG